MRTQKFRVIFCTLIKKLSKIVLHVNTQKITNYLVNY